MNGISVPTVHPVISSHDANRVVPHPWRLTVLPAMVTVTQVNASLPVKERKIASPDHAPVPAEDDMLTSVRIGLTPNIVKCPTFNKSAHPKSPPPQAPHDVMELIMLLPVSAPQLPSLT